MIPFRKGEKLLVDPLSFIKVGMEIDLGGLDGGMAEIFLDDPEILRPAVEFACITMPYLVRGDPLRGIFLEDMLD